MDHRKKAFLAPLLEQTLEALEGQLSRRTLENYRSSINKVRAYAGNEWTRLGVDDVTRRWTDGLTRWLESRHAGSPQTADFYLRTFRALYGHAQALQVDEAGGKPFGGRRPGSGLPAKRALCRQQVQLLLAPGLRQGLTGGQREALDVLLFMLYARGMVFKDVYALTQDGVQGGHIRYRRSKTGAPVEVEVVPELDEIMRRHRRDDSPFVFPFLHEARKRGCPSGELSEEAALRRVNRRARQIGERAGLSLPLTTYVLRHTWATLMLEDGHPAELIGQCMGHTSIRTTQIYLSRISSARVDAAVGGMYDRMLRSGAPLERKSDIPDRTSHRRCPRKAGNKKCPFPGKKETSLAIRPCGAMFSDAKVCISRVCCKLFGMFFRYIFGLSFLFSFLFPSLRNRKTLLINCFTILYASMLRDVSFLPGKGHDPEAFQTQ